MVLKNVLNHIKGKKEHTQLSNDTLITLSQIESGCLFVQVNDKTLMIIIGTGEEITNLKNLEKCSLKTELIERPEFPTIAAYVTIHTKNKSSYDFEYYFNIEASEELELLDNLCTQKNIEILLYEDAIVHSQVTSLHEEDRSTMTSLLEQAKQLFDKA